MSSSFLYFYCLMLTCCYLTMPGIFPIVLFCVFYSSPYCFIIVFVGLFVCIVLFVCHCHHFYVWLSVAVVLWVRAFLFFDPWCLFLSVLVFYGSMFFVLWFCVIWVRDVLCFLCLVVLLCSSIFRNATYCLLSYIWWVELVDLGWMCQVGWVGLDELIWVDWVYFSQRGQV